jgi:branched-subunit amino acid permease
MTYFLILPAFVLWLIVAGTAALVARLVPALSVAYPYVWRIALWATAGLIAANAALVALLALGFVALGDGMAPSSAGHDAFQLLLGLTAIGGPVVASALGWLVGAVLGFALGYRRSIQLPPNNTVERDARKSGARPSL